MKCFLLSLISLCGSLAYGYEFKLHFTPPGGAQGLNVAGYRFSGSTVVGNCSYYTVSSSSGRGGAQHDNLPLQYLLLGPLWQPDQFDSRGDCSGGSSRDFSDRDRDHLRKDGQQ
jgi:hypothetical protein